MSLRPQVSIQEIQDQSEKYRQWDECVSDYRVTVRWRAGDIEEYENVPNIGWQRLIVR
jgi:hypothetical protein